MRRRLAIAIATGLTFAIAIAGYAAQEDLKANGRAVFAGAYTWQPDDAFPNPENFGGFSAIAVTNGGTKALILSDRSHIMSAQIQRQKGRISGLLPASGLTPLKSSRGRDLWGRTGDSEGLALKPGGGYYISFEGVTRVVYFADETARSKVLPRPAAFDAMRNNSAFEALAIDARGWLYTLPEKAFDAEGNFPVYRWNGTRWQQPFSVRRDGSFLPVAAEIGPDGQFYLLERRVTLLGFQSRLRRWSLSEIGLGNEQTLLQSGPGQHDNLEGLSIWRDGQGQLIATMISDNNFQSLQRTELVEYILPD